MNPVPKIGDVEKKKETAEFEWKISGIDFFSDSEGLIIYSPPFYFADTSWTLIALFRSISKPEFLTLELRSSHPEKMKCYLGLKKMDSSIEHLSQRMLKENNVWGYICYIKLSEIERQKSELAPSDVLTITCKLKNEAIDSDQSETLHLLKLKELKRLNTLSDNFRSILSKKNNCDTTLLVMDKEYKAHRTVLIARSTVFAAMFLHETSEKQTGIVKILDCNPDYFEDFLEFLYTGKLEKPLSGSALHLYKLSDKYDIQELKTLCVEFLMENLTIENFCDIAIFADSYDEKNLLTAAQDYFNKNINNIFETSDWDSLVERNYSLSKKLLKEVLSVKKVR